jgi:hypothetical protein
LVGCTFLYHDVAAYLFPITLSYPILVVTFVSIAIWVPREQCFKQIDFYVACPFPVYPLFELVYAPPSGVKLNGTCSSAMIFLYNCLDKFFIAQIIQIVARL